MQSSFVKWTEKLSPAENEVFCRKLAYRFAQLSGVYDLAKAVRKGSIAAICTTPIPWDLNPWEFSMARQAKAVFEKNAAFSAANLETLALDDYERNEWLCKQTNDLFRQARYGSVNLDPYVNGIILAARRKISRILGEVPSLSELKFQFGPGASTSCKKRTSAKFKLNAEITCSHELADRVEPYLAEAPTWLLDKTPVRNVGELVFVPKSYKAMRSIVIEPLLNTFYQKGVGSYMKKRLKLAGVNLYDQSLNQRLAQEGSYTGSLATLDLSAASDTVSYLLVQELLPEPWFELLDSLRTGHVKTKRGIIRLEKFSSMGNAYTFELESLIYYSLAAAVVDRRLHGAVSVYGDDIIIPAPYFDRLSYVLHVCGFRVNHAKSYADGPFRESCGKDYLLGSAVRPCYLKDSVSAASLFVMHNFYVRRGTPRDLELARWLHDFIPLHLRLYGPDGYGDGHLLSSSAGYQRLKDRSRGFHGFVFDTFTLRPLKVKGHYPSVYPAYSIYVAEPDSVEPSDPVDHDTVRGNSTEKYRRTTVYSF